MSASNTARWAITGVHGDDLRKPLMYSAAAHIALAVIALVSTFWKWQGSSWGEGAGTGGAATVRLVSAASVPLPAPRVPTQNRVATESPGLHQPEPAKPAPKPKVQPPPEKAVELPARNAKVVPESQKKVIAKTEQASQEEASKPTQTAQARPPAQPPSRSQKEPPQEAGNEIPFGQGGPAQGPFGMFQSESGTGGFNFSGGSGDFGSRFSWYVTAIRSRISNNWLRGTVDPRIQSAPRVFIAFQILRDGSVANVELTSSSGITSLDRSALRAVFDSSPMPSLPPEYPGSKVDVEFWFDFRR